jgi:hypothetical protein
MYRLDPSPHFWTTVKVRAPGENAKTETFRAKFRALPIDDFNRHDLSGEEGTRGFLVAALVDIDEIEAPDGSLYRFNDEFASSLINIAHVRAGLVAAYLAAFRDALSGN